MNSLELRVPPLALVIGVALLMWLLAETIPAWVFAMQAQSIISICLTSAGVLAVLAGASAFRKAKTTVNPMVPESSSALVTGGIYGMSRNPMYLGFLIMLAGWGVHLGSLPAICMLPVFVIYMNRFQIGPEEKALSAKFGDQYVNYMSRVRRWL